MRPSASWARARAESRRGFWSDLSMAAWFGLSAVLREMDRGSPWGTTWGVGALVFASYALLVLATRRPGAGGITSTPLGASMGWILVFFAGYAAAAHFGWPVNRSVAGTLAGFAWTGVCLAWRAVRSARPAAP